VKKYVQGCFKCQQNKIQHQKKAGELHPLDIPEGPWQEISIDIIGPLPKSNRMDAIVVIVNRFTKMIRLKTTNTNISSERIAKIYKNEIWKLHGIPRRILSDRGLQFVKGLQKSWEQTTCAMEEAQKRMKMQFDKKRRNPQELKPGDYE